MVEIWNGTRKLESKSLIDLPDRDLSQVWRFELRMGSKQLRNKWEMRSWYDLETMVGDAFVLFCEKISYRLETTDTNRSRWPIHELWGVVRDVVAGDLHDMRSGVVPEDIKAVNRAEHMRMLDGMTLGLLVSRVAAQGVVEEEFIPFAKQHFRELLKLSREHPVPIDERLAKAAGRYRFR